MRREQIIDAAEKVLLDREPAEITFDQVAATAGVSRGLVYNYFGDRGGLFAAMYLRSFDPLVDEIECRLRATGVSPERKLRDVVEVYLRFAVDHPSAWKLVGNGDATEHPVVRAARQQHIERISATWGDTADVRLLASGIIGFLEGATTTWLAETDLSVEEATDVIHGQLWSGLSASGCQEGTTVSAARQQYHATTLR